MARRPCLRSPAPSPPIAAAPVATATRPAADPLPAAATEPPAKEVVRYDVKKAFGAIARIHTQASAITARQQSRLEAFARRYIERTAKSKAFTTAHRPHLADPRALSSQSHSPRRSRTRS